MRPLLADRASFSADRLSADAPKNAGRISSVLLTGWLLGLAAFPTAAARAAGFDCARAATPIERRICADATLSRKDSDLAAAYRDALAAAPVQSLVREAQAAWLKSRDGAADLQALYDERIAALRDIAKAWHALPDVTDPAAFGREAYRTPSQEPDVPYQVESWGLVDGARDWYYQLLVGTLDGLKFREAIVFAPRDDGPPGWHPIAVGTGDSAHFFRPEIIVTGGQTLLHIPGHLEGTGNFNAESLWLIDSGPTAEEIDLTTWLRDLAKRLPAGLSALKGIYPDYRKMTARTSLWKAGDANCCPSGGQATIRLTLKGRQLTIAGVTVRPRGDEDR